MEFATVLASIVLTAANAGTLLRLLKLLRNAGPESFNYLVSDIISVTGGTFLLAAFVDIAVSGVAQWELADYIVVGLLAFDVVITGICSTVSRRRKERR